MKTNLEKNKEIAKMLGWVYLSNLDIDTGKYHESIKAGWYTKLPKKLILKLTYNLYIGRNHHCLQFDTDWNRLMLAVDFVEKITDNSVLSFKNNCFIPVMENYNTIDVFEKDKKQSTFEAIYLFAKQFNEKQ